MRDASRLARRLYDVTCRRAGCHHWDVRTFAALHPVTFNAMRSLLDHADDTSDLFARVIRHPIVRVATRHNIDNAIGGAS